MQGKGVSSSKRPQLTDISSLLRCVKYYNLHHIKYFINKMYTHLYFLERVHQIGGAALRTALKKPVLTAAALLRSFTRDKLNPAVEKINKPALK